jgi:hypothetical protein
MSGYFGTAPVTTPALVYNATTQPGYAAAYSPPGSPGWGQPQQVVDQSGTGSPATGSSPAAAPVPMWVQRPEVDKPEVSQPMQSPLSPAPDYTSQAGHHSLYPSVAAMFYGAPNPPGQPGPSTSSGGGLGSFGGSLPVDKDNKRFSG